MCLAVFVPRNLKLEECGGLYHVINRGNTRHPVFATDGAKVAFERTLWETIIQFGWRLHAYVIMHPEKWVRPFIVSSGVMPSVTVDKV